jgi:hypothetical protein
MKIMKLVLAIIVLLCGYSVIYAEDVPKDGYVPNEKVAIDIAEAVLVPIVGSDIVNKEKPFHAKLELGVWVVSGTAESPRIVGKNIYMATGGPCEVKISKTTGQILSAYMMK